MFVPCRTTLLLCDTLPDVQGLHGPMQNAVCRYASYIVILRNNPAGIQNDLLLSGMILVGRCSIRVCIHPFCPALMVEFSADHYAPVQSNMFGLCTLEVPCPL